MSQENVPHLAQAHEPGGSMPAPRNTLMAHLDIPLHTAFGRLAGGHHAGGSPYPSASACCTVGVRGVGGNVLGSLAANMAVDPDSYCVGLEVNANHLQAKREGVVTGR